MSKEDHEDRTPESLGPIFIIGSGRSGTHWIANILGAHPQISATIEKPPIFEWVTTMAMNPQTREALLPQLIQAYQQEMEQAAPCRYLDKSHPNLWLVEQLLASFPNAQFVGIERNPFGCVASMIVHGKGMGWHDRWREFPIPNRFLGITEASASEYDALPLAAKCALRWVSHHEEMERVCHLFPGKVLVVKYESLIQNAGSELKQLEHFLHLEQSIPEPKITTGTLSKWRSQLSPDQFENISQLVKFKPDEWGI